MVKKIAIVIMLLAVVIAGCGWYAFNRLVIKANVILPAGEETSFMYIPTGSDFNQVIHIFEHHKYLHDLKSFRMLAKMMEYPKTVRPGKYTLKNGMNNKDLIMLLRSGKQTPVHVTFSIIRTCDQLAGIAGKQLECDSTSILQCMKDPQTLNKFGFNEQTLPAMFIPNTYEFYWNTNSEKFLARMKKEYDSFWTDERKSLAKNIQLSPVEVSILASIVEQETTANDEKPIIAGVYLNRLRKNWKLEADPTLVFALGDFTIRRVLNEHKVIDSPYNTYMHEGLPPGPICIPSVASINAVLHAASHSYMFFCAREDFSGFHNFAADYKEQINNAHKFQKALNKRKILN